MEGFQDHAALVCFIGLAICAVLAIIGRLTDRGLSSPPVRIVKFALDPDDLRALEKALRARDGWRVDGENVLPDGDSCHRGALLGEICRDWLDSHEGGC